MSRISKKKAAEWLAVLGFAGVGIPVHTPQSDFWPAPGGLCAAVAKAARRFERISGKRISYAEEKRIVGFIVRSNGFTERLRMGDYLRCFPRAGTRAGDRARNKAIRVAIKALKAIEEGGS